MVKFIKAGPSGGYGAEDTADLYDTGVIPDALELAGMNYRIGSWIDAIQPLYRLRGTDEVPHPISGWYWGGTGGTPGQFLLDDGEYITEINGEYHNFVNALTFYTSKGRTIVVKGTDIVEPLFQFVGPDEDWELAGFWGRAHTSVDAVGVYLRQRSSVTVPAAEDLSPNAPNGSKPAFESTAGVIVGLAGDASTLYGLSLNAGVWKSSAGEPWVQLPGSPGNGCCIATHPADVSHVVVGECDGAAVSPLLNDSGLWESFDAGATWTYTFDPLSVAGCTSQAVLTAAFSPASATLFIGTKCGVGRRGKGAAAFDFSHSPPGIGAVTALAMTRNLVWARTATELLFSDDDGLTWSVQAIPASVTLPATVVGTDTIPAGSYQLAPDDDAGGSGNNDYRSLAAVGTTAFLPIKLPTAPGNHNSILIHDRWSDTWRVQFLVSGDGRGYAGSRFVKAYVSRRGDLPLQIGKRIQLFFSGAQDAAVATGIDPNGDPIWDETFAHTFKGGPPPGSPPYTGNRMHPDIWDIHLAPDGETAWISGDGGVYQQSLSGGASWTTRNAGLHTHHAHMVTLLQVDPDTRPKLLYPTQDNDGWFQPAEPLGVPPSQGQHTSGLGDANYSAGDCGNPGLALIWRRPGQALLTAMGDSPPLDANFKEGQPFALNNDETYDGPLAFQLIQTLAGEAPAYPLLDAVMLVNLPLKDTTGTPVPGPLGQPNPQGNPVLIRAKQFAAAPDANVSKFAGWEIVQLPKLPQGTRGFWVSGGHATPTYYAYSVLQQFGSQQKDVTLHKQGAAGGWEPLPITNLFDCSPFWPAFVNPYDPGQLFVLTAAGVVESQDGGATFHAEVTLTALITGSGRFPLMGSYYDGTSKFAPVGLTGRTREKLATLSHMAFDRDHPGDVIAASPFTGAFLRAGDGKWRTLTPFLPSPLTSASGVALSNGVAYVSLEGRGLIAIRNCRGAPIATGGR